MARAWIALAASCAVLGLGGCGSADMNQFVDDPGTDGSPGDTSWTPDGTPYDGTTPPPDGSTDGITPPPDSPPPPPPVTLDNVCSKMGDAMCTSPLESCCSAKSLAYDSTGCKDGIKFDCDLDVADVKAGKAKFDASKYDACMAAYGTMITKCSLPVLEFVKLAAVCSQLFVGSVPPGSPCTRDSQCAAPVGAWGNCNGSGVCETDAVVGKDASCTSAGVNKRFCDTGLYCSGTGGPSTCKPAKPLGGSCAGPWESYTCGFGNTCNLNKCAPGAAEGTFCTDNLACASWSCSFGRCTDPNVTVASPGLCSGAG
jgi:hypothetical protein